MYLRSRTHECGWFSSGWLQWLLPWAPCLVEEFSLTAQLLLQQLLDHCSLRPWTSKQPVLISGFLNVSEFAVSWEQELQKKPLRPGMEVLQLSTWHCPKSWVRSLGSPARHRVTASWGSTARYRWSTRSGRGWDRGFPNWTDCHSKSCLWRRKMGQTCCSSAIFSFQTSFRMFTTSFLVSFLFLTSPSCLRYTGTLSPLP